VELPLGVLDVSLEGPDKLLEVALKLLFFLEAVLEETVRLQDHLFLLYVVLAVLVKFILKVLHAPGRPGHDLYSTSKLLNTLDKSRVMCPGCLDEAILLINGHP
jgi:hypothetical protein